MLVLSIQSFVCRTDGRRSQMVIFGIMFDVDIVVVIVKVVDVVVVVVVAVRS